TDGSGFELAMALVRSLIDQNGARVLGYDAFGGVSSISLEMPIPSAMRLHHLIGQAREALGQARTLNDRAIELTAGLGGCLAELQGRLTAAREQMARMAAARQAIRSELPA